MQTKYRDRYRHYLRDTEQVLLPHGLTAGEVHERHASGLVLHFRRPERERVLPRLLRCLARTRLVLLLNLLAVAVPERAPLEVDDALDLDRLLALEAHPRELVHGDLLAGRDTRDVLVVRAPLERGPRHLLFLLVALRVCARERAEEVPRLDIPHGDVVALVLGREVLRALFGALADDDRVIRPGGEVLLVRREVDELHERVREPRLRLPGGPAPETHTLSMEGRGVGAQGRPG